jgi:hypothetical protein
MSNPRRAFIAIAGAAVLFGYAPAASAQDAASVTAVGWWTQRPGASALPDGGFEIAGAPSGPISEAALRVEVRSAQISFALLELTESSQVFGSVAGINACPTTDSWKPANPGAWGDAPTPRCESVEVPLSRSDTGLWTGDVSRLLRVGTVSIVLVGVPATSDGAPIAFQTVFAGARLTASAPTTPTAPPPETSEPPAYTSPDDTTTVVPTPDPSPATALEPPPAVLTTPEEPGLDATTATATDPDDGGESAPWWRLIFLVPISIAVGIVAAFVRRAAIERGITPD